MYYSYVLFIDSFCYRKLLELNEKFVGKKKIASKI